MDDNKEFISEFMNTSEQQDIVELSEEEQVEIARRQKKIIRNVCCGVAMFILGIILTATGITSILTMLVATTLGIYEPRLIDTTIYSASETAENGGTSSNSSAASE